MGVRAVLEKDIPGLKAKVLERSHSSGDSAEGIVLYSVSQMPGLCGIYRMAGKNSKTAAALVEAGRQDIARSALI